MRTHHSPNPIANDVIQRNSTAGVGTGPSYTPPDHVSAERESHLLQVATTLERLLVRQRPPRVNKPVVNRMIVPNYTWLMDTLRDKVEEVKAYPALAKINHWQGRVVIQVEVLGNGRLRNATIEQSSGYQILDEAALETVRAASPLKLTHALKGAFVVMSVPLSYQLD
ncbi:hypothetical protein YTPLAS18_02800 [Nitrospira sp.]|nr:hypothetical protein YTPLAS18_02800 [Nitrospira sp.]